MTEEEDEKKVSPLSSSPHLRLILAATLCHPVSQLLRRRRRRRRRRAQVPALANEVRLDRRIEAWRRNGH